LTVYFDFDFDLIVDWLGPSAVPRRQWRLSDEHLLVVVLSSLLLVAFEMAAAGQRWRSP